MQAGFASVIMYARMKAGWFTGKKLPDYFKPGLSDAYNSRCITNGLDKAADIAKYHRKFLVALKAAEIEAPASKPAPPPPDIELTPAPVPARHFRRALLCRTRGRA
jgi:putative chitinase